MIVAEKSQHHVSKVVGDFSVELDITVTLNRAQISLITLLYVSIKKRKFCVNEQVINLQTPSRFTSNPAGESIFEE